MSIENRICANCVSDEFLKAKIRGMPRVAACDYCEEEGPTLTMGDLTKLCDTVIEQFYELSSETVAVAVYDQEPDGLRVREILEKLVGSQHDQVNTDLEELLLETWFDRSSMENRYGEEPWFIEKIQQSERLSASWEEMEKSLRMEARYVNPLASKILESVFEHLLDYRTRSGTAVVIEVGADCVLNTLYRARTFQTESAMEDALKHPERHIGPLPGGIGPAGRMNAQGVAVFYGSTDKEIAISEIRPAVGSYVVVGAFKIIRKLRLLDLPALRDIDPKTGGSFFDPTTFEIASRCDFLTTLTDRLSMPVMPEQVEQGYLITQATADYLSTHPTLNLDGILFHSSQQAEETNNYSCRNVILFNKASKVRGANPHRALKTLVQLWDYDEMYDEVHATFKPMIWTTAPKPEGRLGGMTWSDSHKRKTSLELDRNALEINLIRGVSFTKETFPIKNVVRPANDVKSDGSDSSSI